MYPKDNHWATKKKRWPPHVPASVLICVANFLLCVLPGDYSKGINTLTRLAFHTCAASSLFFKQYMCTDKKKNMVLENIHDMTDFHPKMRRTIRTVKREGPLMLRKGLLIPPNYTTQQTPSALWAFPGTRWRTMRPPFRQQQGLVIYTSLGGQCNPSADRHTRPPRYQLSGN